MVEAEISIHAPTRGATQHAGDTFEVTKISIHAPTRGATVGSNKPTQLQKFQSTLPREERQSGSRRSTKCSDFNPRSHERSDVYQGENLTPVIRISIHAPTRGATNMDILQNKFNEISIHAPTRGATVGRRISL